MSEIKIDNITEMKHGETRVFEFSRRGRNAQGFLICYKGGYFAYLNQCCHWVAPLDLEDGDFYYPQLDRITCKTHGATYNPESGICDSGPCVGSELTRYDVLVEGDCARVITWD